MKPADPDGRPAVDGGAEAGSLPAEASAEAGDPPGTCLVDGVVHADGESWTLGESLACSCDDGEWGCGPADPPDAGPDGGDADAD